MSPMRVEQLLKKISKNPLGVSSPSPSGRIIGNIATTTTSPVRSEKIFPRDFLESSWRLPGDFSGDFLVL